MAYLSRNYFEARGATLGNLTVKRIATTTGIKTDTAVIGLLYFFEASLTICSFMPIGFIPLITILYLPTAYPLHTTLDLHDPNQNSKQ